MWKVLVFCFAAYTFVLGYEVTQLDNRKYSTPNLPVWDDQSQSLYWVSTYAAPGEPVIFQYNPSANRTSSATSNDVNGFGFIILIRTICIHSTNYYLVGIGDDIGVISWDESSTPPIIVKRSLFSIEQNDSKRRTSAGIADQKGNYIGGTYSTKFCGAKGNETLWMYGSSLGTEPFRVGSGIKFTAGIQVNQDNSLLYHVDPCTNQLTEYKIDPNSGNVDTSSRRVVIDFKKSGISPSSSNLVGLAIDSTGKLYIPNYNKDVLVVDPSTRKVTQIIHIGVDGVVGVAFGGIQRDTLYVIATGIRYNLQQAAIQKKFLRGHTLYAVTGLGATGNPSTSYSISCSDIYS